MFDLIPDIIPDEKKALEPPEKINDYDYDDDMDQESLQSLLISSYSFYR